MSLKYFAILSMMALPQVGHAATGTVHLLEDGTLRFTLAQEEPPLPPPPLPPPTLSPPPEPPPLPPESQPTPEGDLVVPSLGLIIPFMVGGGIIAIAGIPITAYGLLTALVGCNGCSAGAILIEGVADIVVGSILFFVGNHYRWLRNQLLAGATVSVGYDPSVRTVALALRF
jgi:hypothetical protein